MQVVNLAVETEEIKPKNKHTRCIKWLFIAVCICIFIIYASSQNDDAQTWLAPAHFYYNGNVYIYHGYTVYSLPDGVVFLSEVNNVGNAFTGEDFDGNVDGYIYINKENMDVAYFRWKKWNESVDGKEPYLILDCEKE